LTDSNSEKPLVEKQKRVPKEKKELILEGQQCPKCKQANLLKGKTAYGCARYKEGCKYVLPFSYLGKNLTPKQLEDLFTKKKTDIIRGFTAADNTTKIDGRLVFDTDFNLTFQDK